MGFQTRNGAWAVTSPKATVSGGCYRHWPTQMLIPNTHQSHCVIQLVQGVWCQQTHRRERLLEARSRHPFGKLIFHQKDSTEAFSKLTREKGAVFAHWLLGHADWAGIPASHSFPPASCTEHSESLIVKCQNASFPGLLWGSSLYLQSVLLGTQSNTQFIA